MKNRFYAKVQINEDGCHLWTAATNNMGYGVFSVEGKLKLAHRVSYEMEVGEIPEDLVLDHLCRVPNCVNPSHVEPFTQRENFIRGDGVKFHSAKTHCPKGHPYSGGNLYTPPSGGRFCRECGNERGRVYRAKKAKEAKEANKPSTIIPDFEAR